MKRIAHIENNKIVSVSIADDDWQMPANCMLESQAIALGLEYHYANSDRKIWPSRAEFWNEFELGEKIAISNSSNEMVKYFLTELSIWNGEVWSDDAKVVQGLNVLVAEQLLTQERKEQILN